MATEFKYWPLNPPPGAMERAHGQFDRALDECAARSGLDMRFPDYDGWLGAMYDENVRLYAKGDDMGYTYPTIGQRRPEVVDWFPPSGRPRGPKDMPWINDYEYLIERTTEAIGKQDVLKFEDNWDGFRIGNGPNQEPHAKIYGCLVTSRAVRFAEKMAEWAQKPEVRKLDLSGKFYELMEPFDSQNKLCLYVPFESLPEVVDFLAENPHYFHNIDFNHPAGVHLLPGVSTVLVVGDSRFDMNLKMELAPIMRHLLWNKEENPREKFISQGKEALENEMHISYHFRYLQKKSRKP